MTVFFIINCFPRPGSVAVYVVYIAGFPNPHGSPFNTGDIFSVKALKVGFCQSPEDYKYITIASTPVSEKNPDRLASGYSKGTIDQPTRRSGWVGKKPEMVDLMVVADGVKMTH